MVVPIRCQDIDLDDVLSSLPDLPLLPYDVSWRLKRVDFQPLEDKMVGKLVTWDGKNINAAKHGAFVKSILTSQEIFHPTPLNVPLGCLACMNKI
jgi:hypothetical protein